MIKFFNKFKMLSHQVLDGFEQRAVKAEEMLKILKQQVSESKKAAMAKAYAQERERLQNENGLLRLEVENLKNKLIQLETKRGVVQVPLPGKSTSVMQVLPPARSTTADPKVMSVKPRKEGVAEEVNVPEAKSQPKKVKEKKKTEAAPAKKAEDELPVDVTRLDFRIGKIVAAKRHPDADSLYVEEIDIGEGKNRTVCSGLVRFVGLEDLHGKTVVLLCNLKPAKMRGITSEAMVMCASTPEKVEVLVPPSGSKPGERIVFEGYDGKPDSELNPKKKIFEQIAPDLKTNDKCVATYKGVPFKVAGRGEVVAPTLANVAVK
jgi:aminoacyl tRNA synthase complex-interacting multifunctional protein 1